MPWRLTGSPQHRRSPLVERLTHPAVLVTAGTLLGVLIARVV
jgi:hypothetical protein